MQTHSTRTMQSCEASPAVSGEVRARLAAVTAWLQRLPLPLIQLLFRLAIAAVFLKGGLTKTANWMLTVQLFADEYQVPVLSPEVAAMMSVMVSALDFCRLASPNQSDANSTNSQNAPTAMASSMPKAPARCTGTRLPKASR